MNCFRVIKFINLITADDVMFYGKLVVKLAPNLV
jgi:hypothetical protein